MTRNDNIFKNVYKSDDVCVKLKRQRKKMKNKHSGK